MNKIEELLSQMGNTMDEVVQCLRNNHIRGVAKICTHCPVANYLKAKGIHNPSVGIKLVCGKLEDTLSLTSTLSAEIPSAVEDFIIHFDLRPYSFPELRE